MIIVAISASLTVFLFATGKPWKSFALRFGMFALGVILVASPWWVRNCVATRGFAPFGTSGAFGLSGGYCDQAYENFGNWNIGITLASQQETIDSPGFFDLSLPEQELKMGQDSTRRAIEWILANPAKVAVLMLMKGYSHLGFYRQPWWIVAGNAVLFIAAIIGCYAIPRNFGFWVAIFLLLSLTTTMLTWPHFGRYSIPVRPLIHMASGIGTVAFWTCVLSIRRKTD